MRTNSNRLAHHGVRKVELNPWGDGKTAFEVGWRGSNTRPSIMSELTSSPRRGETEVGWRRDTAECPGSWRDHDAAPAGVTVDAGASQTRWLVSCSDRRIRRRRAVGRLGSVHAVRCCGLPLQECRFRRRRGRTHTSVPATGLKLCPPIACCRITGGSGVMAPSREIDGTVNSTASGVVQP